MSDRRYSGRVEIGEVLYVRKDHPLRTPLMRGDRVVVVGKQFASPRLGGAILTIQAENGRTYKLTSSCVIRGEHDQPIL